MLLAIRIVYPLIRIRRPLTSDIIPVRTIINFRFNSQIPAPFFVQSIFPGLPRHRYRFRIDNDRIRSQITISCRLQSPISLTSPTKNNDQNYSGQSDDAQYNTGPHGGCVVTFALIVHRYIGFSIQRIHIVGPLTRYRFSFDRSFDPVISQIRFVAHILLQHLTDDIGEQLRRFADQLVQKFFRNFVQIGSFAVQKTLENVGWQLR